MVLEECLPGSNVGRVGGDDADVIEALCSSGGGALVEREVVVAAGEIEVLGIGRPLDHKPEQVHIKSARLWHVVDSQGHMMEPKVGRRRGHGRLQCGRNEG